MAPAAADNVNYSYQIVICQALFYTSLLSIIFGFKLFKRSGLAGQPNLTLLSGEHTLMAGQPNLAL